MSGYTLVVLDARGVERLTRDYGSDAVGALAMAEEGSRNVPEWSAEVWRGAHRVAVFKGGEQQGVEA